MGIINEFKTFIQRGNVVELAVGLIMGAAFGKIVSSLVADVLMPPLGLVLGRVKFTNLKIVLGGLSDPANPGQPIDPVTINYGNFLQTLIDFFLISLCVFFLVKGVNYLNRKPKPPEPPKEPSNEEKLLTEIRDLLKAQAEGA